MISRRKFLVTSGAIASAGLINSMENIQAVVQPKTVNFQGRMKVALIGTGSRGCNMWGRDLVRNYSEQLEFVGLCDSNPGRLESGKNHIGTSCPTFTDFEQMMRETKPDLLIVCTVDNNHHEFIAKGMEMGSNVLTEKPMTIDEQKIQTILDAEKKTGKHCRITFNYRYSPHRVKIWELLRAG